MDFLGKTGSGEARPGDTVRIVLDIADEAAKLIMRYYRHDFKVEYKGGDKFNPVTEADRGADDLIRRRLAENFPGDSILSEENDDVPQDYRGRVWIVDPLDGTKDFENGCDGFAVQIALAENGRLLLGVVNVPARRKVFFAARNSGAFMFRAGKPQRIHTSDLDKLPEAIMIMRKLGGEARPLDRAAEGLPAAARIRDSSVGIRLCRIASGEAQTHVNTNFRVSKWDTAAPQLILEEAGGVVTDIDGNALNYAQSGLLWSRSFAASCNAAIHRQVIEFLSKAAPNKLEMGITDGRN